MIARIYLAYAFVALLVVGICYLQFRLVQQKSFLNEKITGEAKLNEFYFIMVQWIRVHNEGRSLADYFIKNSYRTVAIYGMKELGEALLQELRQRGIEVRYAIDRDADKLFVDIDIRKPDDHLDSVDAVVVTAVHYYDEIKKDLSSKMRANIVSLEDVVWEA